MMSWAMRQREALIDERLRTTGKVNRSDVVEAFEVSQLTASKDLQLYERNHPGRMVYDQRGKAYVRGPAWTELRE